MSNTILLENTVSWQHLLASFLLGFALIYRYGKQPNNIAVYGIFWTVEIFVIQALALLNRSHVDLAIANIFLALVSLLFFDWLCKKKIHLRQLTSLQIIPLLYALLAIIWRWHNFTAYTGLITLGAGLIGFAVSSRRSDWKSLTYVSIIAISIAEYELVIYQMLQSQGGNIADAYTIFAIVAATIALIYRIFLSFWRRKGHHSLFNLTLKEIEMIAHIHWAIACMFKIAAAVIAIDSEPKLTPISVALSLVLATYAIVQGKDRNNTQADWWIYIGFVEILATAVYARLIWNQLSILDPWRAILACAIALIIYQIPWQNWGWRSTPWHRIALIMPAFTALIVGEEISYLSLLVVATFYGRIAFQQKNIRWSYLSLLFLDWGIIRFLFDRGLSEVIYFSSIVGLSLLYIAQFDSYLTQPQSRKIRHYLRIFGSGIICLTALFFYQETGILPSIIGLSLVFIALALRIRAFLFVGTITFILTIFYQLVVLIFAYSFLKWIVGLVLGIILIGIAANFEKRKEQINSMMQNRFIRIDEWQ